MRSSIKVRRCGRGFELTVGEGGAPLVAAELGPRASVVFSADEAETIMSAIKDRRRAAVSNAARFGDPAGGLFEGLCALAGDGLVSAEPPSRQPSTSRLWTTLMIAGLPRTEVRLTRSEAEELHRSYLSQRE